MCGRFSLRASAADLFRFFGLLSPSPDDQRAIEEAALPRYNIAPGQPVLALRAGERGPELALLHWGLIPAWSREDPATARRSSYRMINARLETAAEKPSFRKALAARRCLVPTSGFYEWGRGSGAGRPATLIDRPDGGLFALAGIWERWEGPGGERVESLALLTMAAEGPVAALHDRMPLIIAPEDHATWVLGPAAAALALARPVHELRLRSVGSFVNNARNEGPACWGAPALLPSA